MDSMFEGSQGVWLRRGILAAVVMLVVFLAVEAIAGIEGWRYIGSGIQASNTITVSGHGEVFATPDIAEFTFSVVSDKTTVADAQADATAKINAITAYLTAAGISKDDIQTTDYSIQPQYDYQTAVCPQVAPVTNGAASSVAYCPPGQQVLKGYEVDQTTTVKVRDTSKAGDLLTGVGSKGATQVSGLNFTFDNPDAVQDQARDKAIADAKSKADTLAKELGVSLVRVVSYNENSNPGPIYYKALNASAGATASVPAASPDISVGQNDVTSDVSITYEIR
jgi:uncharacterized protein YggE